MASRERLRQGFACPVMSRTQTSPMPRLLRAKLYRVAMVRWVDLPRKLIGEFSLPPAEIKRGGKGWNALLRFNGDIDRVTLRAAGVDSGDEIAFTLEPDAESRDPELPDEMQKAFRARPQLRERWLAHSVAIR